MTVWWQTVPPTPSSMSPLHWVFVWSIVWSSESQILASRVSVNGSNHRMSRRQTYFNFVSIFLNAHFEWCISNPMGPTITKRRAIFNPFILLFHLEVGINGPHQPIEPSSIFKILFTLTTLWIHTVDPRAPTPSCQANWYLDVDKLGTRQCILWRV